ncbi:MAG: transposase [Thermomicrobiales bacterium]
MAGRRNPDGRGGGAAIYDWCESEHCLTIGLTTNPRYAGRSLAAERSAAGPARKSPPPWRGDLSGRAGPSPAGDRGAAQGPHRFVVTTRDDPPEALYDWYVERGDGENAIKSESGLFADRELHRFWANQFRLLLHAAAYWLLDTVRRWLSDQHVPRLQLDTLRLRLLKIGGRVYQWRDHVPAPRASHPGQPLWDLDRLSSPP